MESSTKEFKRQLPNTFDATYQQYAKDLPGIIEYAGADEEQDRRRSWDRARPWFWMRMVSIK